MRVGKRISLLILLFLLYIEISSIPLVKGGERQSLLIACKHLENNDITPEVFIKLIYNITVGSPPDNESLTYWLDLWRTDPKGELTNNKFSGTSCPIVGINRRDSTRVRTFALLIIRSQLSLSAEMKRPSGTFDPQTYSINLLYGSSTLIVLLLLLWRISERFPIWGSRIKSAFSSNLLGELLQPKLGIPIIVGMAIRLLLAPLTEQRWDMYMWRLYPAVAYIYRKNPFWLRGEGFYSWGYPPLWLLICVIIYAIYNHLWPNIYPQNVTALWGGYNFTSNKNITINVFDSYRNFLPYNLPYLDLFLKIPIILSDLMVGLILYKIISEIRDKKSARQALLIWFLNPFTIFISSIWGMFDSLTTLAVLISIYSYMKKRYIFSFIILGVAIITKLYPLIIIPIYIFALYKEKKDIFYPIKLTILLSIQIALSIFLPYLYFSYISNEEPFKRSIDLFKRLIIKRASPDWMGRNLITGLTPLIILNPILNNLNLKYNIPISPILMLIGTIYVLFKMYENKKGPIKMKIISYVCSAHYVIYLTYSTIHVQHLIWIMPLLILIAYSNSNEKIKYIYLWLTIIGIIGICVSRYPNYNLSYFVSPYFLFDESQWQWIYKSFTPTSIEWILFFTLNYIIGMKSILENIKGER